MKLKTNLDEILYHKIIECLIRGDYRVGQKILLDELCERFEVSRTPVVQATKLLNKDGILTIMSNGRVYVPEYETDMIRQICELRLLLEGFAIEKLMADSKRREETCRKLEALSESGRGFLSEKKFVELAISDLSFHKALVGGAGSEVLNDIYHGVQGRFIVANYLNRPLKERDYAGTVEDHDRILSALREGSAEEAKLCLSQHIGGIKFR